MYARGTETLINSETYGFQPFAFMQEAEMTFGAVLAGLLLVLVRDLVEKVVQLLKMEGHYHHHHPSHRT